jgi:photosystem II stability/assembly factor-like uncharacterized protein
MRANSTLAVWMSLGLATIWACGEEWRGEPVEAVGQSSPATAQSEPIVKARGSARELELADIPWNGRIAALSLDPSDGSRVLAASDSGGLFRSVDAGLHWKHVDALSAARLFDVKRSPRRPNIVLVAAAGDGRTTPRGNIWLSRDAGRSWVQPATARPPASAACNPQGGAYSIAFAPDRDDVFVGTECGLAVSHDAGRTWQFVVPDTEQVAVASVLAHAGGVVDVTGSGGFRRSTDGAASFGPASNGPLATTGALSHALAGDAEDPSFVLLATQTPSGTALLESSDGGANWIDISGSAAFGGRGTRPPFVVAAPSMDGQPGHLDVYFGNGVYLYRQTCSGSGAPRCDGVFQFLPTAHADPSELAFDPITRCARYLATDGGLHVSSDCGESWPLPPAGPMGGLNALQVYEVAAQVHPQHTDLYFGTQDNSFWASPDGGATWPRSAGVEGFLFSLLRATPSDEDTEITFSDFALGVLRASAHFDSVQSWNHPPVAFPGIPAIAAPHVFFEFARPDTGPDRLWLTTDSGTTWAEVPGGEVPEGRSGRIFVGGSADDPVLYQPLDSPLLVRITGALSDQAVVEAADVGLSSIGAHCTEFCAPMFAVDPLDPNHLLAADANDGVMKVSRDGRTWQVDQRLTDLVTDHGEFLFATGTFGTQASALSFHPTRAGEILVGTDGHGVIKSLDGGRHWFALRGTQAIPLISSFAFDDGDASVIVASFGRGLWRLPD